MPHIFISYSKKDTRELAFALTDALNALPDVTTWVDRSLRAGPSWEAQIQREILKCDYFVVLYSPDINRHLTGGEESYVLNEISYAKSVAKKPIIPVMAQTTTPPIGLIRAHYIDYTLPGLRLDDLVAAICAEVDVSSSAARLLMPVAPAVAKRRSSLDLLPAPFEWITIPAGQVTLEEGGYLERKRTFDVARFTIAKYPLTNAQYRLFVEAGGYNEPKWWTEDGWARREADGWTSPRHWTDSTWNGDNQPVVGVSWYEAVAYCQWLSDVTGEAIMLPTEAQWQYAAQGDDGRAYPWGDQWDESHCNNNVNGKGVGRTTAVRQYEGKGESPFGVVDMVGNVWEWCRTSYQNGTEALDGKHDRVLRGGAWNLEDSLWFRCDERDWRYALHDHNNDGFRLARS